jgi:hypothetical protein
MKAGSLISQNADCEVIAAAIQRGVAGSFDLTAFRHRQKLLQSRDQFRLIGLLPPFTFAA